MFRHRHFAMTELERLRASEDELRLENEHLREIVLELEQVRETYFELYDLAAVALVALNRQGVIQNVNRAAVTLLQKDRKFLTGFVLHAFIHGEDRLRLNRHLQACQELQSHTAELRIRLVQAQAVIPARLSTRWVHTSTGAFILAALMDDRDDVSAAHEKQRLVDAEQRARQESESKDQFIAMLSHELRTPLTPILAACSSLEEDPELNSRLRNVFASIARNAHAEARLIDDLLDATGILRGKLSIVNIPVDVSELLEECLDALQPEADQKDQTIELEMLASNPWIEGDSLRLRQVFTNLVRNSIKFTPAGSNIQVRSWNGDRSIVVEVQDSGIGFAPESTGRFFKPFDRLNDKPHTGGLGLGLAIAKGIVELHHGKIDAVSRGIGQGARFVVDLPTIAPPTARPPRSGPVILAPMPRSGPQRLLLVEDHADTAEMLTVLLQQHGFSVVVADSMASALDQDDGQIQLVISDLGLPDGTGMELIRKLQSIRRRPAIALSGFGMQSDVLACKAAGFDLHLTKPITVGRLLAAIQSLGSPLCGTTN